METHELPFQATALIGRDKELTEFVQLLADPACRLLTLVGPGGIGKTRLAIQTAGDQVNAFTHGVYFVPLAPLDSPDSLIMTIGNTVHLSFHEGSEPKQQLLDFLREKHLLLLLDNIEHLLDAANLVSEILEVGSRIKILITSRETLNLQQEWVRQIAGLSFPEDEQSQHLENYGAVQLFTECARHIRADFSLTAEWSHVVRICQLIQGTPLAVELAAAWLKTLACEDIASEIQQNVDFLATGLRNIPERHRSMRAVFEWSWKLLTQEERNMFQTLSAFRGSFRREAATQVAGASLRMLSALVDKSLLKNIGAGRYDVHELLRQYAWEKLTESDEMNSVLNRHLDYFLELAEGAETELFRAEQVGWFKCIETEHANLRAAIEWSRESGNIVATLRLMAALYYFWSCHGYHREDYNRLRDILSHTEAKVRTPLRAKALSGAGYIQWFEGSYDEARVLLEEALSITREFGDQQGIALATRNLGPVLYCLGEYESARLVLEESLGLQRELRDSYGIGWVLQYFGDVVLQQGDRARAQELYRESVAVLMDWGDKAILAYALRRLGLIRLGYKDYHQSVALCQQSMELNLAVEDRRAVAACLVGFAGILITQDQAIHAVHLLGTVAAFLNKSGAQLLLPDRVEYEHHIHTLRDRLDVSVFSAAWAEGQALSLEKAVANLSQSEFLTRHLTLPPQAEDAEIPPLPRISSRLLREPLTEKELEVLRLMARGLSNPEIADQLIVGVSTVKKHINHIFSKLDVTTRTQAIVRAQDLHLL